MLSFGVNHPVIEVIEWTPGQLEVISGQKFLLPVYNIVLRSF